MPKTIVCTARWAIRTGTVIVAVVLAAASLVTAAEPNSPARRAFDMSASDVGADLTRMLLDRPEVPVTLPKGVTAPKVAEALPPDGSMVVDRLCRLERGADEAWSVLRFEAEPNREPEPSRRGLPCLLLEQMEDASSSPGVMFRVSGETTVYGRKAYLLVMKAVVVGAAVAAGPKAEAATASVPEPAGGPASMASGADAPEATAEDIMGELLRDKPGRPLTTRVISPVSPQAGSVAPGAGRPLSAGRGAMVVDRLVRILAESPGPWLAAHFESDNTLQDPPMRLLPCGYLGRAEWLVSRRGPGLRPHLARVSGEVTEYRGGRYLLIRKLLPARNLGEL